MAGNTATTIRGRGGSGSLRGPENSPSKPSSNHKDTLILCDPCRGRIPARTNLPLALEELGAVRPHYQLRHRLQFVPHGNQFLEDGWFERGRYFSRLLRLHD